MMNLLKLKKLFGCHIIMAKNKIKLFKGRFYTNYKSGGNHPSLLYKKNKRKNNYSCVIFDSTSGRHRTKMKHPISPDRKTSFIQNRPMICKKNDFGNHQLNGLSINKEDKILVEIVKRRKPRYSSSFKNK